MNSMTAAPAAWTTTSERPTIEKLRARRVAKAVARVETAREAVDAAGDDDHAWMNAAGVLEDALRVLEFDDPAHPVALRERAAPTDPAGAAQLLNEVARVTWMAQIVREPADWPALVRTPAHAQLRDTLLGKLAAKLLSDGLLSARVAELVHRHNRAWCIPPLADHVVDRIVDAKCDWWANA